MLFLQEKGWHNLYSCQAASKVAAAVFRDVGTCLKPGGQVIMFWA